MNVNEGTITSVDQGNKRITVRFADGTTEKLYLKRSPADDPREPLGHKNRAIVYHSDASGRRVTNYFKLDD